MEMNIRPMKPEEQAYSYTQDNEILENAGCLGHLRGDMGRDGDEFWTTWDDHVAERKTEAFQQEFQQVIQALRDDMQFGGLFRNREQMKRYCSEHPEGAMEEGFYREYGFRADTEDYSYMIRCNPNRGEYNFYVYVYNREMLEEVLQPEKDKIRVLVVEPEKKPYVKEIDPGLESLQREVGGYIEVTYPFEELVGLVCDEEGKLKGSTLNRALRDSQGKIYDILAGTFLVVGLGEEDFTSLTDENVQQFSEFFGTPELFVQINGKLMVIPLKDAGQEQTKKSFSEHIQDAEAKFGTEGAGRNVPDMSEPER